MATFVPYASCYKNKKAVQLLGRNSYLSLLANPPCLINHRQQLVRQAPEMTLRQINQLIRILRQLNLRDAKKKQLSGQQSSSTESQKSQTSNQQCLFCFQLRCTSDPPGVG